jgi:hypothetical protein
MNLTLLLEMDLDFLSFIDAIEVAALRALCKATQQLVADAPEHAFEFTFAPIIPLLLKFDGYKELNWVILRLCPTSPDYLVQVEPRLCPARQLRALHNHWRRMGIDPSRVSRTMQRRSLLVRLVHAFWNHAHVQSLLATAIRLDSTSLLRRVAAEAPGECLSDDGDPNTDGTANFMYNAWVAIEEDNFDEEGADGVWAPLGRDDATAGNSPLFFGAVHFVLWKYMAAVRKRQQRDFNGYCRHCDFCISGLICDARCPREEGAGGSLL